MFHFSFRNQNQNASFQQTHHFNIISQEASDLVHSAPLPLTAVSAVGAAAVGGLGEPPRPPQHLQVLLRMLRWERFEMSSVWME